jgi:cytochrome b
MDASSSAALGGRSPDRVEASRRRVVDAPTRMFHVLFALSFAGAYLTAESEHWRALHVTLGYVFAGLLAFRVGYGLFGPRQAGLGLLWRRLAGAGPWLRSLAAARSLRAVNVRHGQNLAMALAIVSMLVLALPLVLSGYGSDNAWGDWLEEVHELLGNALLALVLLHLALIAALSLLRRQNLALPMLTGHVSGSGPDLVRHNRAWLAGLLLAAVLALGAWQWLDSPRGSGPAGPGANPVEARSHGRDAGARRHRDDD